MKRFAISFVMLICCFAAAQPTAGAEHPEEIIVYTTLRPANWDVFLFPDGDEEPRKLTSHPALDYNATFSPDGNWVVFTSERNGNADLFALNLHTSALRQLTKNEAMDDAATFSPDGESIAFVSTRTGSPEVFLMQFSQDDETDKPTNLTNSQGNDLNPAFSPDGKTVAFSSNRKAKHHLSNDAGLYVMNADGTNQRRIATGKRVDGCPAWSPDGRRIYFNSRGFGFSPKPVRLYSVSLDGSNLKEHTGSGSYSFGCTVRRDGAVAWTEAVDAETFSGVQFAVKSTSPGDWSNPATLCDGYLRPRFDATGERMLCHGQGPLDAMSVMPNGNAFDRPGADRIVKLPDRDVRVLGVRAYFPSLAVTAEDTTIVALPWLHAKHGKPIGPSPIVRANIDGSDLHAIVTPQDEHALWATQMSRDGGWLLYSKGPPMAKTSEDVDIWRVRADGTDAINLTADSDSNDAFADVSEDRNRIVFRSGRDSGFQIYVCDGNGEHVKRVTDGTGRHTMPAISPDGTLVVYSSQRKDGFLLFVKSLDEPEGDARLLEPKLKDLARGDLHPRFSPDGKWVVFTSSRGGLNDDWHNCGFYPQPYGDLWAAPADASHPAVRLTDNKWEDGLPCWGRLVVHP